MKTVYKDPWEMPQRIVIPDGDPEALQEVLDFCNENARLIQNADRRERYHTPYHLEGLTFEGKTMAYRLDPERIYLRKERSARIWRVLCMLTDAQRRRLLMHADGMTLRQIAKAERTTVNAVKESLDAAKKKCRKNF